eukprot:TRINITY_DN1112_c2_g1_i1.p1 TRINITY_DN1112_c2_g1~~TRINITY_DN1112_c2_g1_i1.p1  ORF type:complete len:217 (-),score=72.67 TRINITY_DN1112_c2_g1_i1:182-757(-)
MAQGQMITSRFMAIEKAYKGFRERQNKLRYAIPNHPMPPVPVLEMEGQINKDYDRALRRNLLNPNKPYKGMDFTNAHIVFPHCTKGLNALETFFKNRLANYKEHAAEMNRDPAPSQAFRDMCTRLEEEGLEMKAAHSIIINALDEEMDDLEEKGRFLHELKITEIADQYPEWVDEASDKLYNLEFHPKSEI